MRKGRTRVVGPNKAPRQRVRRDKPTHAQWHEDGTVSIVHPEGHDPKLLVRLPRDYSEATHVADHEQRRFVRRSPEPPAKVASLEDRVAALEAQIAGCLRRR